MILVDDLNLSPGAAEKRIAELRAIAESLGLVVAARCKHCGAPLWNSKSLNAHAGPVCRARHEKRGPGATPAKKSRTEAA